MRNLKPTAIMHIRALRAADALRELIQQLNGEVK